MMPTTVATVAYLVAGMLFIVSLRGLSEQKSAQRGNLAGVIGMLLAVAVSSLGLFGLERGETARTANDALGLYGGAVAVGALIGSLVAARVQMTAMPELVAVLHSFVGVAAVFVGIGTQIEGGSIDVAHFIEVQVGVFVGAVTFTGSLVAFAKLRGTIGSRPLLLPGRHVLNLAIVGSCVALAVVGYSAPPDRAIACLLTLTGLSALLGVHLVWAIGGGDMPVVVSLLNSYSGWAAAAAGFMLENDLLIITGALVGSSGAILSAIMCRAMNRSIWNVVFGGFGAEAGAQPAAGATPAGKIRETNVAETAELLKSARSVIVIPGYGMAVAQAQHPIREVSDALRARGVNVRFAIHPVAGRLPGHMNVLLAEAGISYDVVKELDEINDDFGDTDVVVVIGANDIVNPSAVEDRASPIFGMPVLEAWKAARVVMLKRSMAAGYAGVENPLCYRDNTLMLFGDAKQTVQKLLLALQA